MECPECGGKGYSFAVCPVCGKTQGRNRPGGPWRNGSSVGPDGPPPFVSKSGNRGFLRRWWSSLEPGGRLSLLASLAALCVLVLALALWAGDGTGAHVETPTTTTRSTVFPPGVSLPHRLYYLRSAYLANRLGRLIEELKRNAAEIERLTSGVDIRGRLRSPTAELSSPGLLSDGGPTPDYRGEALDYCRALASEYLPAVSGYHDRARVLKESIETLGSEQWRPRSLKSLEAASTRTVEAAGLLLKALELMLAGDVEGLASLTSLVGEAQQELSRAEQLLQAARVDLLRKL